MCFRYHRCVGERVEPPSVEDRAGERAEELPQHDQRDDGEREAALSDGTLFEEADDRESRRDPWMHVARIYAGIGAVRVTAATHPSASPIDVPLLTMRRNLS